MLKIDISKTFSPRFGIYLLAIIPGLFFVSSVAIGNPHLAASLISRVREIYPFGPYGLLFIFVASALLIGQAFIVMAWIVDVLIALAFVASRYALKITFASRWLYHAFGKLQGSPPKRNIFIRLLSSVIFWGRSREFAVKARPVVRCLHVATKQLLKKRYGIENDPGPGPWDGEVWQVWHSVLGKPLMDFRGATIGARIFLGSGLAGFTALYAIPPLRQRYFVVLSLLLALAGLFTAVSLASWRFNAVKWNISRLRSVLMELSEANEKQRSDSVEDSSATISTGEQE